MIFRVVTAEDDSMAMNTGAARAPWYGALVALGSIAVVSVFGVARDWDLGAWLLAALACAVSGVVSAVSQARRHRKLDRAAEQARASELHPSPR